MEIESILEKMRASDRFLVKEPKGKPVINEKHFVSSDVEKFHQLCGGIECYADGSAFSIRILSPEEVSQANLVLLGEEFDEDISSSWYLIADAEDQNYISIDFSKERNGRCYESFVETHALKDNCPIIARSFTELLLYILTYEGDYFYWKDNDNFVGYGDAYQ